MSMLSLLPWHWPATHWAGRLLPHGLAEQQPGSLLSYFVKYQYSGKMLNIALYLTFCSLLVTAMIS